MVLILTRNRIPQYESNAKIDHIHTMNLDLNDTTT